jgi:hypothetical protein
VPLPKSEIGLSPSAQSPTRVIATNPKPESKKSESPRRYSRY